MTLCSWCGGIGEDRYDNPCTSCGGNGIAKDTSSYEWEPFCIECGDEGCPACDYGKTPNYNKESE